jgi:VanZ family protein
MASVDNNGLVFQPYWKLAVGLLAIVIIYLSWAPLNSDTMLTFNDKLLHFLAYFVFTFLFIEVVHYDRLIMVFYGVGLFSFCIEYGQSFIPYRSFEVFDLLANIIGITVAIFISNIFAKGWLVLIEKMLIQIFRHD